MKYFCEDGVHLLSPTTFPPPAVCGVRYSFNSWVSWGKYDVPYHYQPISMHIYNLGHRRPNF